MALEFCNIKLSYDGKNLALKDFNYKIMKGDRVAICGRTGSGKSSIVNILFHLYECQDGCILINGRDSRGMSLKEIRQKISIVP
jgi:ABC-type multidrug transport system fused ATPase/permease subunit